MADAGNTRRRIAVIVSSSVLLLAGASVAVVLILRASAAAKIPLGLVHPFENPVWVDALNGEMAEFQKLLKRYEVKLTRRSYEEIDAMAAAGSAEWDLALGSSRLAGAGAGAVRVPEPFTGSLWGLYYSKRVLSQCGILPQAGKDGLAGTLASGSYGLSDLEQAFQKIRARGVIPISVGSRYGWPEAVWVQAIMAAQGNVDAAAALVNSDSAPSPALDQALAWFRRVIDSGAVDPKSSSMDWPESLHAVARGTAGFCLLNEELLSALTQTQRAAVGYLPLPGSVGEGETRWAMGSLVYLAVNPHSRDQRGASRLFDYLASQGVTGRLWQRIGAPFFSRGAGPRRLFPSIASAPNHPILSSIKRSLEGSR